MITDLKKVSNLETLLDYFATNLGWNIDLDYIEDLDDLLYDFKADMFDLTDEYYAKITSINQVRPLHDNQPWGIFAVEFEGKKLEITALRKILSKLVPRGRNSSHAMWKSQDLMFLCFWGVPENRTVGIAHFSDNNKNLPTLKLIHCATRNAVLEEMNSFKERLSKLEWINDPSDARAWSEKWSKAFTIEYGKVVKDSKTLATHLADLAKSVRKYILDIYKIETANGYVHLLFNKFKEMLVHDLTIEQFADMYAQTIAYGLFSARCMDTDGHFELKEVVEKIPNTNPFLKELLKEAFAEKRGLLSFDELELDEIVSLLDNTDTDHILRDFNRQTGEGREDPVIYFYEGFLSEYESQQKKRRGVYYTPLPAVDFMVRAVDDLLKTEFGFEQGLADTSTKKQSIKVDNKTNNGTKNALIDVHAIQILDPATGTGTFLRQVILQIWENFKKQYAHLSEADVNKKWNEYVPEHLLKRLNGFELMMAPYAVAHMKLALILKETGYDFGSDERINVFLTNSLEEAGDATEQITFFNDALAHEAISANNTKKDKAINVIIGNPPYSKVSSNNDIPYIVDMLKGVLPNGEKTSNYYEIDGKALGEIKVWLQDDYVKFIRYAQYLLESRKTSGIIAFVTNNGFLDNPTFRGMRQQLLKTFYKIYILNLNGGTGINRAFDGKDENLFDIKKSVSINIFVYDRSKKTSEVYYKDLFGTRNDKYTFLNESTFYKTDWNKLSPNTPFYLLIPQNQDDIVEYNEGIAINKIMPLFCTGITTSRDSFVIDFEKDALLQRLNEFKDLSYEDSYFPEVYGLRNNAEWDMKHVRKSIQSENFDEQIVDIQFRPFDRRKIVYNTKMLHRPRYEVMKNMLGVKNIALLTARINKSVEMEHFFCTDLISETKTCEYTTNSSLFPLYYLDPLGEKKANISETCFEEICKKLCVERGSVTPEIIFDYIYSVLFSKQYRVKYKEYLRLDFPKIPFTSNKQLFNELVSLGGRLRELHVDGIDVAPTSSYVSSGNDIVETIKYNPEKKTLHINKESYFAGVDEDIYSFTIGGYQVCNKYLKDRKGRTLSSAEIEHYKNTVSVIEATIATMQEIDVVIDNYGGFPIK